MSLKILNFLAFMTLSAASSAQGAGFLCRSDWDCASSEFCEQGACEAVTSPRGPSPSNSSAWSCRNDFDCGSGESCLNGSCSAFSGGSSSDDSDTPIFGG